MKRDKAVNDKCQEASKIFVDNKNLSIICILNMKVPSTLG